MSEVDNPWQIADLENDTILRFFFHCGIFEKRIHDHVAEYRLTELGIQCLKNYEKYMDEYFKSHADEYTRRQKKGEQKFLRALLRNQK